jgi:hypothetical protein
MRDSDERRAALGPYTHPEQFDGRDEHNPQWKMTAPGSFTLPDEDIDQSK